MATPKQTVPAISHTEVCDLARLTILVYEYGNMFTIDKDKTVESFVSDLSEKSEESEDSEESKGGAKSSPKNKFRVDIIKDLARTSPHGKVHKFYNVESTDLQAGITISELHKRITVVFRGSESSYDWYYDLAFWKKNLHDSVYVHGGFYKQLHTEGMYETIKSDLLALLADNPDYTIYVTGHSLGAALSTLFGYELSREIDNHVTVVSFASPRVGNPAFRTAFDAKSNLTHYRVSNNRDMVTAAPMINFQHVGTTNIALSDGKCDFFYNYNYNTWFHYSLFSCWSVTDHYMDSYYKHLLKHKWD